MTACARFYKVSDTLTPRQLNVGLFWGASETFSHYFCFQRVGLFPHCSNDSQPYSTGVGNLYPYLLSIRFAVILWDFSHPLPGYGPDSGFGFVWLRLSHSKLCVENTKCRGIRGSNFLWNLLPLNQ